MISIMAEAGLAVLASVEIRFWVSGQPTGSYPSRHLGRQPSQLALNRNSTR